MKNKRLFYGWIVVFGSVLLMATMWGMANHPLNLYLVPVTEELGFSRTAFSMVYSIINMLTAVTYLVYGRIYRFLGLKRMILTGCGLCVLAFLLFSFATTLPVFYIAAATFGIAVAINTNNAISQLLGNWFHEKLGTILGFVFATSGLSATFCDMALGKVIENKGFTFSFRITLLCIVILLSIACLVIRETPEEMGLTPYGEKQAVKEKELSGPTLKEALRTAEFWLIFFAEFFWGITMTPIVINIPAFLNDQGLDAIFVSGSVMATLFAVSAASKFLTGLMSDKFGLITAIIFIGATSVIATVLLPSVSTNSAAMVMAVLMGLGYACISIPPPLLVSGVFGSRNYAEILGIVMTALAFGASVGSPISNYLCEQTGSYVSSFYIQAVFFALAAVFSVAAVKISSRR